MKSITNFSILKKYITDKPSLTLLLIIIIALIVRLLFYSGNIFSDDSYYSQLAYSLLKGDYPDEYIGYPIFLVRKLQTIFTLIAFVIIGTNEIASIIFPLLFSLGGIILIYKLSIQITGDVSVALIAAFLLCFFPTDIIFATINFVDLQCAFFIDLGIYFLYKSYKLDKILYTITAGILFLLSFLLKENVYFILILLTLLFFYFTIKNRKVNNITIIPLIVFAAGLLIEGIFYYVSRGDYFYRLTNLKENYIYCYYDFFPYILVGAHYTQSEFFYALLKQIFILNPKYLFIRRFYLFLPIIALVQSLLLIKNKEHKILVFWFLGLAILMIVFPTSIIDYKPLDLRRSWYIFTVLPPIIILASIFISRFKFNVKIGVILIYVIAGIFMSSVYQDFFDAENKNQLKEYITVNNNKLIYTDHHTKYSIDLIDKYKSPSRTNTILGKAFNLSEISAGSWIIFNKKNIDELKLQGHLYPSFDVLNQDSFIKIAEFGDYQIFETQ